MIKSRYKKEQPPHKVDALMVRYEYLPVGQNRV